MDCSTSGLPVLHHCLEFAQTHVHESVMPSNHLILCCPLLLPSIFPSIKVFSNESALRIRWPKYWSFSFNISPSNEHPGLIFRMDWWHLLAVQGTLKSLTPLLTESRDQSLSLCFPRPKAPFPCTVPVAEARGAGPPARWSRRVERCADSAAPAGLLAAAIPLERRLRRCPSCRGSPRCAFARAEELAPWVRTTQLDSLALTEPLQSVVCENPTLHSRVCAPCGPSERAHRGWSGASSGAVPGSLAAARLPLGFLVFVDRVECAMVLSETCSPGRLRGALLWRGV